MKFPFIHGRHHHSRSAEDLSNPEVSADETHTSLTNDILSGLKSLVAPVTADPSSANVYIPAREGGKHGSVFRRVSSMRPPSLQVTAGTLRKEDVWTQSRHSLEDAIKTEQEQGAASEKLSDEQRLGERLDNLKLVMHVMGSDGACLFRSISYNLWGTEDFHKGVRRRAVEHIGSNREEYECFLADEDFEDWLAEMSDSHAWGDELCVVRCGLLPQSGSNMLSLGHCLEHCLPRIEALHALVALHVRAVCDSYGVVVNVLTSDVQHWFIRYEPKQLKVNLEVWLTYIAPIHYNSIQRRSSGSHARPQQQQSALREQQAQALVDAHSANLEAHASAEEGKLAGPEPATNPFVVRPLEAQAVQPGHADPLGFQAGGAQPPAEPPAEPCAMEAALDSSRLSAQGSDLSLPLTRQERVSMSTEGSSPAASRVLLAASQLQGGSGQPLRTSFQAPVSTLGPAVQMGPPMPSPFQQVQVPGFLGPQPGPGQSTSPHCQVPCSDAVMHNMDDSLRRLDANLS